MTPAFCGRHWSLLPAESVVRLFPLIAVKVNCMDCWTMNQILSKLSELLPLWKRLFWDSLCICNQRKYINICRNVIAKIYLHGSLIKQLWKISFKWFWVTFDIYLTFIGLFKSVSWMMWVYELSHFHLYNKYPNSVLRCYQKKWRINYFYYLFYMDTDCSYNEYHIAKTHSILQSFSC